MKRKLLIHLHNVRLYAYHGVHSGERETGGEYEVSLTAAYIPPDLPVLHLHQTIDYTALYEIVRLRMEQPAALLETVVADIADTIIATFPQVTEIIVSVKKIAPPIAAFSGSVGVSLTVRK